MLSVFASSHFLRKWNIVWNISKVTLKLGHEFRTPVSWRSGVLNESNRTVTALANSVRQNWWCSVTSKARSQDAASVFPLRTLRFGLLGFHIRCWPSWDHQVGSAIIVAVGDSPMGASLPTWPSYLSEKPLCERSHSVEIWVVPAEAHRTSPLCLFWLMAYRIHEHNKLFYVAKCWGGM